MAISVSAPTKASAAVPATLRDKKWKCLRPVPGAFHDIHSRWSASKEKTAVCNCINLVGAATCACCGKECDSKLSVAVD